ncbi:hypothetical protein CapIbe_013414, partial [Capra ibex]
MGSVQHHCCPQPKMGDASAHRPWPRPPRPALLLVPLLVAAGVMPSDGGASCPVLCTCHNQAVDCSGQRLFSVPPELPVDTRNLSLAHNRIAAVPPGYLTCYRELRVLSLRNNSLVELPAGLFLHAKRLAHLDLSYNNLSHVPAGMFQAAHGLLRIDLSHNPGLRRVHPRAFQGLAQLRDLDLSFGGLAFLSLEALEGLPGLVTLQIGGNPWVCGCTMEPLLKWLRNRIQRCTADSQLAECRGPPEVEGAPPLLAHGGELQGLPPDPDPGRLPLHRLCGFRGLHRIRGHQLPPGHHCQLLPPLEQGQRRGGDL